MSPWFRRGSFALLTAALLAVLTGMTLQLPGAAAAPLAEPYTGAASVAVSSSNPCQGAPLTITGVGYVPGSVEVLTIGATVIGRPVADAQGAFSITVTLPDSLSGQQTVSVVGPSGGRLATTQLTIERCGNGGTDPGGGSGVDAGSLGSGGHGTASAGSGGLSTTGVAVFGLLGLAALLLIGGVVLTFGGRRRRVDATGA
jgi:hypothetical protein